MDSYKMPPVPEDEIEVRRQKEIDLLQQTAMEKMARANETPVIDDKAVSRATEILRKYKEGKAKLEQKIIANEEYWKLRQWGRDNRDGRRTSTAHLWSCIQARYSDAMDSYPTCTFQPRQQDDQMEAVKLSSIVPVVLEQNRYEDVYSDVVLYTLKNGGSVQGVFWDASLHNGLGDISIKKVDFINLFWQPGITDIQKSQHIFHTELVDNDILEQRYPECRGRLGAKGVTLAKYIYDDTVDTSNMSVVVDWYYHTEKNGKKVLQYAKYVNDIVLYATENETSRPEMVTVDPQTGIPLTIPTGESIAERGLYDHGKYPFVTMALYPVEGSICGYGLTDIGKDTQMEIDRLNKAIVDNAIVTSTPRYFIRNDGSVNEEEFLDISNQVVHVEGNLGEENIRRIEASPLSSIYENVLMQKIEEMKYITSNQDVNNGSAPTGITAASAIAALQETSGKSARSANKAFYRAYREVCYFVVELIRQFYDVPRSFRIVPDAVTGAQFVDYDNRGLVPQAQINMGMDMGLRTPEFDIEISAEKNNPYKKMEINELALQFYSAGFFNPQMSDQALGCLDMMDFHRKEDVMQKISRNGTLQEMLLRYQQLALQLAQKYDPQTAEQIGQMIMEQSGAHMPQGMIDPQITDEENPEEHPLVEKARANARNSTQAE